MRPAAARRSRLRSFVVLAALAASAGLVASAPVDAAPAAPLADVPGGKDSPIISRFAGSSLVGYQSIAFDQIAFPRTGEIKNDRFANAETVEGRVTRLAYLAPPDKSVFEVRRNYEDALVAAGFEKKFSCDNASCSVGGQRVQTPFIVPARAMTQVKNYGGYSSIAFMVVNTSADTHYVWGTLKSGGRDVHVGLLTTQLEASTDSPLNKRVGTYLEIVEPKAMDTGQVSVDANAMKKALEADGRIALYGVYFDTGKSDIKPESKPQLDEMAKLLDADRSVKVFIVGHTDNQGAYDANVSLSQRRAEAIAAALARDYRIDPKRLVAKGVANIAPVASNAAETGRAKNRRVELVRQ